MYYVFYLRINHVHNILFCLKLPVYFLICRWHCGCMGMALTPLLSIGLR